MGCSKVVDTVCAQDEIESDRSNVDWWAQDFEHGANFACHNFGSNWAGDLAIGEPVYSVRRDLVDQEQVRA